MPTKRSIGMCILFSILTCGIYGLYWIICLNNDVNNLSRTNGTSGGMVILFSLLTCGIYGLYWIYTMGTRMDQVRVENNCSTESYGIMFLILSIFGLSIIAYAILQSEINKYAS